MTPVARTTPAPPNGAAVAPIPLDLAPLRPAISQMQAVRAYLDREMIERDPLNQLLCVSLLAQANVILFGERGTGKSYHAQTLLRCLTGRSGAAKGFWKPMDKYTTPEEIYGKLNVGLLQNGVYEHIITDTLLDCHLAFLDEYLESGAPLLKTLLTVLNERMFKNGTADLRLPLMMAIAATNQQFTAAQAPDSDRWLNKAVVTPLTAAGRYELRLRDAGLAGPRPALVTIDLAQVQALQAAVPRVQIPRTLVDHLTQIDKLLGDGPGGQGIVYSDRRARQMLVMVRASALLAGRAVADEGDLAILQYALWEDPKHIATVTQIVGSLVNPLNQKAKDLLDACVQTRTTVYEAVRASGLKQDQRDALMLGAWRKVNRAIEKDLKPLATQALHEGRDASEIDRAIRRAEAIMTELRDAAVSSTDV